MSGKRKEKEELLEASGVVASFRRSREIIQKKTKGFLGRLLDFVGSVLVGWALLNLPKIISRILPFAFFFTFFYMIAKYENNNQLLIFWNFGVNKIKFVNYLLLFSFLLLIIQIVITSLVVPKTQSISRSLIRVSSYNFLDNFIKIKKLRL